MNLLPGPQVIGLPVVLSSLIPVTVLLIALWIGLSVFASLPLWIAIAGFLATWFLVFLDLKLADGPPDDEHGR